MIRRVLQMVLLNTVFTLFNMSDTNDEQRTIFFFESQHDCDRWYAVNDGVMGGVSQGRVGRTEDGHLRFSGAVSLQSNGGFASIRSNEMNVDLSSYTGLLVRVRGDGQRYSLNVETDYRIRAGSYRCKFSTRLGDWQEFYFPFTEFRPTSFGMELDGAPSLNSRSIRSLGLLISDKQVGPFALEVAWIRAVTRPPNHDAE